VGAGSAAILAAVFAPVGTIGRVWFSELNLVPATFVCLIMPTLYRGFKNCSLVWLLFAAGVLVDVWCIFVGSNVCVGLGVTSCRFVYFLT
jgi:hypothetical protein